MPAAIFEGAEPPRRGHDRRLVEAGELLQLDDPNRLGDAAQLAPELIEALLHEQPRDLTTDPREQDLPPEELALKVGKGIRRAASEGHGFPSKFGRFGGKFRSLEQKLDKLRNVAK